MPDGGFSFDDDGAPGARGWSAAPAPLAWLKRTLTAEEERWPLWLAVALGLGVGLYLALPAEPPAWAGGLGVSVGAGAAWAARRWPVALMAGLMLTVAAIGFAVIQVRSMAVAAPVLAERLGPVEVSGRVAESELVDGGRRVVLAPVSIAADAPPWSLPSRVRVRVNTQGGETLAPGQWIALKAVLLPPPEPSAPDAFAFPRRAWFEGLGAVGYAVSPPEPVADAPAAGPVDALAQGLGRLRQAVAGRVLAVLPGEAGAVSAALITGERGAIPDKVMEDYRASGLAHLLSISGLHMSLVAGIVFLGLRRALALAPAVALRWDTKKLSAVVALLAIGGYLAISGAGVPTQRAFVMTSVVLVAVLIDRTAISMRVVAWAAAAVLLWRPEALAGPSFQMSFAAVIALVAVYEGLSERVRAWRAREDAGPVRMAVLYLGGVMLTTVVASLATAPFAVHHFHKVALLGLVANLLAVPLTALWVMPFAIAALVAMPFGLDAPFLHAMGWGVEVVDAVAAEAARWPSSRLLAPATPTAFVALVSLGGLWLCLWRTRWRWGGLAPVGLGIAMAVVQPRPDVLIDGSANLMAARDGNGRMTLLPGGRGASFTRNVWAEREGVAALPDWTPDTPGIACDSLGCVVERDGLRIAQVRRLAAHPEDCRLADVLVSADPVRAPCAAPLVVDRFDVWGAGAHALTLDGTERPRVRTAAQAMGNRPWTPKRWRRER